jgi:hypothetical protein
VGLTVTATPAVAGRFPGLIMPVPLAKTPVRVALDPSVIEEALAVKLVIEGGCVCMLDDPLPQPVKPARPRVTITARGARTIRCFMISPVFRLGSPG